jgi:hypothetical protein
MGRDTGDSPEMFEPRPDNLTLNYIATDLLETHFISI